MTQKIRVLVVDDSALVRRLVTSALRDVPDLEVVGVAKDGLEAIEQVSILRPDVVTLDIEMPRLDGLGALTRIRAIEPRMPVIMFSTLTERGASATLEALSRGASDYVTKPSNTGKIVDGMIAIREQLVPRIRALVGMRKLAPAGLATVARATSSTSGRPGDRGGREATLTRPRPSLKKPEVLLIGCSTGGPDALARIIPALPRDLAVPVLIVQHMPPVFTAMLAQRLDRDSPLTVREAADGDHLHPGEVLIAPGDWHLRLRSAAQSVRVVLDQAAPENFCRPAVDVLFRSAAQVYGDRVLAVVLTGMGHDGLEGARILTNAGSSVLAQDESTSVVWGMPGAVVGAGLARDVVPLENVPAAIGSALA